MKTYTLPIVGVTFEKRQEVLASIENGEPLLFKREPGNTYDPGALAITTTDGRHVGYVGRKDPLRPDINAFLDNKQGIIIARLCGKRGGFGKYSFGGSVMFYPVTGTRMMRDWIDKDGPIDTDGWVRHNTGKQRPKDYYSLMIKYKKKDRIKGHQYKEVTV